MYRPFRKNRRIAKRVTIFLVATVFISTLLLVLYKPKTQAQIFLTSGTTWAVPNDWNNTNNTIETIGGGGSGGGGFTDLSGSGGGGGGGGGAGGYSRITNQTLTPGSVVAVAIGSAGTTVGASTNGTAGTDTYLCNSTSNCTSITDSAVIVGAKGGGAGQSGTSVAGGAGGSGGASGSGVGSSRFTGGSGATTGGPVSAAGSGGGGAGGAAGLNGNGNNGNPNPATTTGGSGGQGDSTSGGAAGSASGGTGGNGTEYDGSHGSGGGGGGGDGIANGSGSPGGNGGQYGSGGGGGGGNGNKHGTGGSSGSGIQGLIRITYSFITQANYRWRSDDGNETTGSSLAAQDTAATVNYAATARLRMLISNSGDTNTNTYRLEYAPYATGCYSWTTVPATATSEAFNMVNTANYTDQTASTNVGSGPAVITDPAGYSFVAGKLVSNTSNSATVTLTSGQFTEIEYAIQSNSNANQTSYCFRLTNSGTALDSYSNYPMLNINYPPSTPTIYSVINGSTNVTRLPNFQLRSYDLNKDYLKYVVEVCPTNSFACGAGAITYDQTSAQTCWGGQNSQTASAYQSGTIENLSTMAYCQLQTGSILNPNTTYYWRAKAIDPGGSNTASAYSSVATFTTGTLDIQITGGTNITGGTQIGGT